MKKFLKYDEKEETITNNKEKQVIRKYIKSDLISNSKHSFYEYYRDGKKNTFYGFE